MVQEVAGSNPVGHPNQHNPREENPSVKTEVTESGRFERTLTVHLAESELENAKDKAARKLSRDMKIKGFRPGKAPRSVVERMVGADQLRSEAIEEAIPGVVTSAIDENGLEPVTVPQVSDVREADEGGVEVDVRITLWPELEAIPDFSGLEIEVERPEVTEEEIQQQFDALRNQFADLEPASRPADEGDFVMVNITVERNGLILEDASANDLLYEVGSQSFLPGLDELLTGSSAGDIREGPSTLPEGFGEHGGSPVALKVLVKEVRAKKLPDLTDDLVQDATEFESVAELREAIEQNMLALKVMNASAVFEDRVVEAVVSDLDIEIPDGLLDAEVEARVHNLLHRLEEEDISFPDYMQITGQDQETFIADVREQARVALATRVLLEGVAKIEGIEVTPDDLESAMSALAAQSGNDLADVRDALDGQEASLAGDILQRKALQRLVDDAKAVDSEGSPVDLTPIPPAAAADGDEADEEQVEEQVEEKESGYSGQDSTSPATEAEAAEADEHGEPTDEPSTEE